MRKTVMLFLSFFALASVAMFFAPKTASAYPGFARKYNFPCSFCHIQWPKLADTGHFFKDRGFMLSTTGKGNGLDMMFQDPKNQNYFPIGFHMSMAYGGTAVNGVGNASGTNNNYNNVNTNGGWANGASANTPWDIESAGLLNPWISFWVQPGYAGNNTIQIVKLWVRFDDLMNTTWLNLYAGKTSVDPPFSNQRNVYIGTSVPWTMYDYQPGTPEVAHNGGATNAGFTFVGAGLYTDGDMFQMANDVTSIRYFGYHINSGASCSTQSAFSIDPCETRVSVSFMTNSGLYGSNSGTSGNQGGASTNNNGFNYFMHVTQSFGGWGRTNGERIGAFALVGEAAALPTGSGYGGTNPNTVFNREGVDFMVNPIPNGGLNIFGAWEIAQDPTGMISGTNGAAAGTGGTPGLLGNGVATSGVEYMTWLVQADWQPTFHGFFSQSGTNSNMISLIYNQLNMMQQPTFAGASIALPGNYNNVTAFTLSDRYWLWGSDRADISLFAQYQYMINYGVAGALSNLAQYTGGTINNSGTKYFGNVEANNFAVGLDFAY